MKISVVIPAYNRANLICRSIDSALNQTFPPYEVVVVDDCSSDGTAEIVQNNYPGGGGGVVRVIKLTSNSGAQAARAEGIRQAKGSWIAFLDSDDLWLPNKLELQKEKTKEGFRVIHGPCIEKPSPGRKGGIMHDKANEGDVYSEVLLGRSSALYPCLLVHKKCFEQSGFPDPHIEAYQEWDMSISLAKFYPFGVVREPLLLWEVNPDSISADIPRSLRGREQIINKWWKEIIRIHGPEGGLKHHMSLANLAKKVTGDAGYTHYLMLGARRAGIHLS